MWPPPQHKYGDEIYYNKLAKLMIGNDDSSVVVGLPPMPSELGV